MSLDEELFKAVKMGDAAKVKELLKKGANVNAKDRHSWTPLHYAAFGGYVEVVKLLLEHGADVNARAATGLTPIDIARLEKKVEVIRVFEEFSGRGEQPIKPMAKGVKAFREVPSILGMESSNLFAGDWGKLFIKVRGTGVVFVSLDGDIEWMNPGSVKISGESVIEIPVKPKVSGQVPVRVVVRSSEKEDAMIVWLKVEKRVFKCPACGAPAEPGANYCWKCGAKLE